MKILLLGKNLDDIRPLLSEYGLEEDPNDFSLIITHGGDGALLGAERDYPGILKFPIRDQATAPTCPLHNIHTRLKQLVEEDCCLSTLPKISGKINDTEVLGINEVFLHNHKRECAIRYSVYIDDKLYVNEIIGDGVGVATVLGSTGYFHSITHSIFKVGMGLAFSNTTFPVTNIVLNEDSKVSIKILRGPAVLVADNSPIQPIVEAGSIVQLEKSKSIAQIINLDDFMCPECRKLRHQK